MMERGQRRRPLVRRRTRAALAIQRGGGGGGGRDQQQQQQSASSFPDEEYSAAGLPAAPMPSFNRHPSAPAPPIDEDGHPLSSMMVASSSSSSINRSLLCFCNFGPAICELENACIKHDRAACFHAIKQEFDPELGIAQLHHLFGCAPLERGSDASHLTCNSWRPTHAMPRSIACCYQGNLCNRHLPLPKFPQLEPVHSSKGGGGAHPLHPRPHQSSGLEAMAFMAVGFLLGLLLILAIALPIRHFCRRRRRKGGKAGGGKRMMMDKEDRHSTTSSSSGGICAAENGGGCGGGDAGYFGGAGDALLTCPLVDGGGGKFSRHFLIEDSGSGSAGVTLNQRTIALDLEMREVFARGRYGELRKAVYRGSVVAVKIFYTTEEESWRNEREIYLSQMLNHENILQYVAADIMSSVESLTQMMLITDFHPLGSLYDYFRADFRLGLHEALGLAFTTIAGLEHLHNPVRGTGGRRKPEIAHRDIKSKNVLVKRPGVCCLADFGLAVRREADGELVPGRVNVQVGTKRYMAPELLSASLNVSNFEEFKWADIYSFSLVLWEILNRVEVPPLASALAADGAIPAASITGVAGRSHQRLMSQSNSSGFVSASDPPTTNNNHYSSSISPPPPFGLINRRLPPPIYPGNHLDGQQKNLLPMAPPPICGGSSGTTGGGGGTDSGGGTTTTTGSSMMGGEGGGKRRRMREEEGKRRKQEEKTLMMMDQEEEEEEGRRKREGGGTGPKRAALPFQSIVDTDPSFEQMREIVCQKKIRPPIEAEWSNEFQMRVLSELMRECWHEQARSRHTALKVKKAMAQLVAGTEAEEGGMASGKKGRMGTAVEEGGGGKAEEQQNSS